MSIPYFNIKASIRYKNQLPHKGNEGDYYFIESTGEGYISVNNSWQLYSSGEPLEPINLVKHLYE